MDEKKRLVPPRPNNEYYMAGIGSSPAYVVLQVTLKEEFIGTKSKNLSELETVINTQVSKGYRLHTMSTSSAHSTGLMGGDRIQATLVFERLDLAKRWNGAE